MASTKQQQWATSSANASTIHRSVSNTHSIHNIVCTLVPQIPSHRHTAAAVCLHVKYTHMYAHMYTHTRARTHKIQKGELCTYSKFRHMYIQTHVCTFNKQQLNAHTYISGQQLHTANQRPFTVHYTGNSCH